MNLNFITGMRLLPSVIFAHIFFNIWVVEGYILLCMLFIALFWCHCVYI